MPVGEQGPERTYRPDMRAPSMFGAHQPGIATPQLEHAVLTAYDIDAQMDLGGLLVEWTETAERWMRTGGGTVTIGLGPTSASG